MGGKHKLNSYNLGLFMVIALAIVYIGLLAAGGPTPKTTTYNETSLNLSIPNGSSPQDLSKDLSLINQALNQEAQDQKIAASSLVYKQQASSADELNQRINTLSLVINELDATSELSPGNKTKLKSEAYAYIRPLLNDASNPWNAISLTSNLKASYPGFLSFTRDAEFIKQADDQLAIETLFSKLASQMNGAIKQMGGRGLSTADLYADLTTLNGDIESAKQQSVKAETYIISTNKLSKITFTRLSTATLDIKVEYNTAVKMVKVILSS